MEISPNTDFIFGDQGIIVYEDRLLVKGGNDIKYWKNPDADAFLLIFPKKNIPPERYDKVIELYNKTTERRELLDNNDEYKMVGDYNKIDVNNAKIARVTEEILELAKYLGIKESYKMLLKSELDKARK